MTFTTFVNGTLANADEVNTNFREVKWENDSVLGRKISTPGLEGVIVHSTSNITVTVSGHIWNSTDSGVTWVDKNTDLDSYPFIRKCKANGAYAFAVEGSSAVAECAFTSDSSVTWTTKAASLVVTTNIYDVSYPITTLLVICSDTNAGGKRVQFCDPTVTPIVWTACTTSPGAATYCLDMFDGTTGFCVDSAAKIYKTVNNAVDWGDTGHTAGGTVIAGMSIYAMTASTCLIVLQDGVYYYDGTQNAYIIGYCPIGAAIITSITKQTDGNYYFFWARISGAPAYVYLFKLGKWGGPGTQVQYCPVIHGPIAEYLSEKTGLSTYGTDKLLMAANTWGLLKLTRV